MKFWDDGHTDDDSSNDFSDESSNFRVFKIVDSRGVEQTKPIEQTTRNKSTYDRWTRDPAVEREGAGNEGPGEQTRKLRQLFVSGRSSDCSAASHGRNTTR